MKYWIAFLLCVFVVGGTRWGERAREQWWAVVLASALAAASFYSFGIAS